MENFDAEYLRLIKIDIAEAQEQLDDLPERDRRGLTLDTLSHFHCGYLSNWILTKSRAEFNCGIYVNDITGEPKHLPPPSHRIIIPTPSMQHFNAVATPSARLSMDKNYWKQHAGSMELFGDPDALNADLIVVVEGEIDAMTIWQASHGSIATVAILGCTNWKKTLLPKLSDLRDKKLLLLLDADAPGKKAAKKFLDELLTRGCLAVVKFLHDALPKNEQNSFGWKVDANTILTNRGDEYLNHILNKIISAADYDFKILAEKIAQQNIFMREHSAATQPEISSPRNSSTATSSDENVDRDEITLILKDYVHASQLTREDWRNVGMILKRYGFTLDDFQTWSKPDSRYSSSVCAAQWNSFWTAEQAQGKGHTIATLIKLAKEFGYQPTKKFFSPDEGIQFNTQAISKKENSSDFVPDSKIGYVDDLSYKQNVCDDGNQSNTQVIFEKENSSDFVPDSKNDYTNDLSYKRFSGEGQNLDERLVAWQELNGKIAPDILNRLNEAKAYLEQLTPDNFTAADARNIKNIRAVALAQNFGFIAEAEKFFSVLKTAKAAARSRIKESQSELTSPLSAEELNELNALVEGIDIKNIRRTVDREISALAKAHADFLKREKQERARERYQQKRAEETLRRADNQSRIDQLRKMPPSPDRDAQLVQLILQSCEWRLNNRQEPVEVKAIASNADKIFTYDPVLDGLTGYDEFQQAYVFLKPPSWNANAKFGDEWMDADDAMLRNYLRRTYTEFSNKHLVDDWLTEYAKRRSFHEVKDFFRALPKWDGKPRAEKLFVKFLKADDTPYTREVTMNWLTASIARIFEPGCAYQLAPILYGEQGIGKSYLIEHLGRKWYGTLADDVSDPHAIDAIQKLWLVEIKEMAAMKKDIDANKRFIDSAEDTRRAAYERRATKIKRHCVFIITTNNRFCLTDLTGNRRFPVIWCKASRRDYIKGLSDKYIEQVWAEVYAHYNELFKDGFDPAKLELSKSAQIQSDEVAESFTRNDLGEEIKTFLDTKIPPAVIWHLLSREERRKLFTEGSIKLVDGERDLNSRIRSKGGHDVQKHIDELYNALHCRGAFITEHQIKRGGEEMTELWIYGSEYRQHICPAEIFHECFDKTDRRKSIPKILETISKIGGWSQGKRIRNVDPVYSDQKIVFYRDEKNMVD